MIQFLRAGGIPIWIVLLFGIITLVNSISYAWRASEPKWHFVRGMIQATHYSILAGVVACLSAVMFKVPNNPEWAKSPDLPLIIMTGIGESLTPAILGYTFISLAWLILAFGQRRQARINPN